MASEDYCETQPTKGILVDIINLSTVAQTNFRHHCEVILMLLPKLNDYGGNSPAVKHHIRSAVREASNCVTRFRGRGRNATPYMSAAAVEQLNDGCSAKLVFEHVIPISVLNARIIETWQNWSSNEEGLHAFLLKYSITATITAWEDQQIAKEGLRQKMPDDFRWDHSDESAKFSRYEKANIKFQERPPR